jgi:hypothetical protein
LKASGPVELFGFRLVRVGHSLLLAAGARAGA